MSRMTEEELKAEYLRAYQEWVDLQTVADEFPEPRRFAPAPQNPRITAWTKYVRARDLYEKQSRPTQ